MGTLTEELLRQVVVPIAFAYVAAFEREFVQNAPNNSGNLIRNTKVHQVGPFEFDIVGPPYALQKARGVLCHRLVGQEIHSFNAVYKRLWAQT